MMNPKGSLRGMGGGSEKDWTALESDEAHCTSVSKILEIPELKCRFGVLNLGLVLKKGLPSQMVTGSVVVNSCVHMSYISIYLLVKQKQILQKKKNHWVQFKFEQMLHSHKLSTNSCLLFVLYIKREMKRYEVNMQFYKLLFLSWWKTFYFNYLYK